MTTAIAWLLVGVAVWAWLRLREAWIGAVALLMAIATVLGGGVA